ncbi:hypothetical protein D3C87_1967620 [compost metagenome]
MMRLNSVLTGSLPSLAIRRMASFKGRPDLIERTMMSRAFGNSLRNALVRRLTMKLINQRGKPALATRKIPAMTSSFIPAISARKLAMTPKTTLAM